MFRLPTGKRIEHVQVVTAVQIIGCLLANFFKGRFGNRDVNFAPPNIRIYRILRDNAFVARAEAGFFSRRRCQTTGLGDFPTIEQNGMFV